MAQTIFDKPVGTEIATLNSKMSIYDVGSVATLSALETALSALKSNAIAVNDIDITFKPTATFSPFSTTDYIGRFYRINSNRCYVQVYQASAIKVIVGYDNYGTWTWKTVTMT